MAQILDGKAVAASVLKEVQMDVESLKADGIEPKLVVLVVGDDPASAVYVRHKQKACDKVGMLSEKRSFPADMTQEQLLKEIEALNADASVHGMIVQLPLPKHMDPDVVIRSIDPYKDVDGFHAYNMGKMVINKDYEELSPCTPKGIIRILDEYEIDPSGMDAVVIGRSNIVGKPISMMLLNRNATVTMCHSRTKDVTRYTSQADLVVVAVGQPKLLTADMVKEGAVIIDVGMNRLEDGTLCGDVDFESVKEKASAITPVPRGVGPMTVACLLANTVTAARKQAKLLA